MTYRAAWICLLTVAAAQCARAGILGCANHETRGKPNNGSLGMAIRADADAVSVVFDSDLMLDVEPATQSAPVCWAVEIIVA